jgi:hypothetical protein
MKLNEAIKTVDGVIPHPSNKMVDLEHTNIAIAWQEIKVSLRKAEQLKTVCEILAEFFDVPCNYSFGGESIDGYMFDNSGGWCEENCGNENYPACWEKFFELKMEERRKSENG